jgi:type IV secretion system protein VirB11
MNSMSALRVERPVPVEAIAERSALDLVLQPLRPYLAEAVVTELCVNRPNELFLETGGGWRRMTDPALSLAWCTSFAKLVANATRQRIDETAPLLSASLPSGERVQIVYPPATTLGQIAITIRRPSREAWTVAELARRGIFRPLVRSTSARPAVQAELTALLAAERYAEFMRLAVATRQNILVSGPTGSGKTTWTKALIREIPPHERLVTIEDAQELVLDRHPNHVRLYYSKDDQGQARVTPKQLLESCLRMRPDRILLAELRAEEAFDYLRNVNSGHPGSITSVHAGSCALAFEQLVLLVKQSAGGRELARRDIKQLLYRLIDVVIQFGVDDGQRVIQEIWYGPARRRARAAVA